MKKSIFTAFLVLIAMSSAKAQDTLSDATEIVSISESSVETATADQLRLAAIHPEMKYRELKKIYKDCKYRDFTFIADKKYAVDRGVASLGLPGIGQLALGERGIAAAWMVPGILCDASLLTGVCFALGGTLVAAFCGMFEVAFLPVVALGGALGGDQEKLDLSEIDNEIVKAYRFIRLGEILLIAGACGFVTINIPSMIHAIHIAKVKNMYYDDLNKLDSAPKFNLKLTPYMDILAMQGSNIMPVAGLSLKLTF